MNPPDAIVAEFPSAPAMFAALDALHAARCTVSTTYAPFDLEEELEHRLTLQHPRLPWITLGGGLAGMIIAYAIQWWANVHSYPLDVGGRPHHPVPAFIPITFETTVLCAAVTAFVAWMITLGLPRLWAPIDETPGFERASIDTFWIEVAITGAATRDGIEALLRQHGAVRVAPGGQA